MPDAALTDGGTYVDLTWTAPPDDGGGPILYYEICVIEEDGTASPFERTDGPETMWRVRGLAFYHRYGFRHRAVYAAGPGPQKPGLLCDAHAPRGSRHPARCAHPAG